MNKSTLAATTLAVGRGRRRRKHRQRQAAHPAGTRGCASRPTSHPASSFPVVWTTSTPTSRPLPRWPSTGFTRPDSDDEARRYVGALGVNLVLNAGWSWLFFRYHKLGASALGAAVLTVSSADLARRTARPTGGPVWRWRPTRCGARSPPSWPPTSGYSTADGMHYPEGCPDVCCGFAATCGCAITRRWPPRPTRRRGPDEVLACFVLDPRLEASSGRRRLQFLGDSLRQLRDDLDGRLLVTRGRPDERIPRIAKEIGASSVHISEDFAPFGRRRDERVRTALGSVPLVATGSPYLVSPGRVTKDDGTPYKVFTPFFRAWREVGWRAPARSGADSARWLDPAQLSDHASARSPTPAPSLTSPPVRQRHLRNGQRSSTTGWTATARTATGPTSTAPAGCRRT